MLIISANQLSAIEQNVSKSILIDHYLIFAAEVLRNSKSYQTKFYQKFKIFENLIFLKVEGNFVVRAG